MAGYLSDALVFAGTAVVIALLFFCWDRKENDRP